MAEQTRPTLTVDHPESHAYDEEFLESQRFRLAMVTCHAVTIALSVLGNLFLIIYVLRATRCSRNGSSSQTLILNLALCDLVRSMVLSPIKLCELLFSTHGQTVGYDFCLATNFLTMLLAFVGFHTVVAISQERLLLICFPFKAREWLTSKTIGLVLAFIWLSAVASSLTYALTLSSVLKVNLSSGLTFTMCTMDFFYGESTAKARGYTTFVFVFYYALPVVVVTASYVKISVHLVNNTFLKTMAESNLNQSNHSAQSDGNSSVCKILKARQCLAKMMMVIAACFAIFNCPVFILFVYYGWGFKIQRNAVFLVLLSKFLPILSSCLNPFVYCSRSRTLKRNFHTSTTAAVAAAAAAAAVSAPASPCRNAGRDAEARVKVARRSKVSDWLSRSGRERGLRHVGGDKM